MNESKLIIWFAVIILEFGIFLTWLDPLNFLRANILFWGAGILFVKAISWINYNIS